MLHVMLWWWSDGAAGGGPLPGPSGLPIRGFVVCHPVRHPVSEALNTDRYEA